MGMKERKGWVMLVAVNVPRRQLEADARMARGSGGRHYAAAALSIAFPAMKLAIFFILALALAARASAQGA